MSRINRPPISIARLSRHMKKVGREGKIAVVVGSVTDDARIFKIPKMTVCLFMGLSFLNALNLVYHALNC